MFGFHVTVLVLYVNMFFRVIGMVPFYLQIRIKHIIIMSNDSTHQRDIAFDGGGKCRALLERCGYNPDAPGLAEILKEMHNEALSQGLAARAFKKWQEKQKIARVEKGKNNG